MKKSIFIIILCSWFTNISQAQMDMKGMNMPKGEKKGQPPAKTSVIYTCVMHPEIRSDKPGKCPKCGMQLVKKAIANPVHTNKASGTVNGPIKKTKEEKLMEKEKPAEDPMNKMNDIPMREVTKEMEQAVTAPSPAKTIKAPPPRKVRYDLYVNDTVINFTGRAKKAIAINGSIPAPTLVFNQGDTAEIHVHNLMKHETSIHWHGIILPNTEDGVPYLTTAPIKPGKTRIFRFPIVQNGTYWYHSHTKVQEQSGMYGALIFNKREEPDIKQYTLVLSDWSDMRPKEIDRSLHNQTDWFGIRKHTIQSYAEAIKKKHFKTKVENEWKRMLAMDVSDVAYDRFLVNGAPEREVPQFKKGDRVKLRIVNGGASTYFWLTYAGGKITVVANDGEDVEPVEVDRLIVAVAETYDVIVTIPEDMSYEFLVTPEDRTKYASLWLGKGMKMPAEKLPKLKYFAGMKMMNDMMKMNGNMTGMEGMSMTNQTMDMNTVMYPEITGEENPDDTKSDAPAQEQGENGMQHDSPSRTHPDEELYVKHIRDTMQSTEGDMHMKEMTKHDREKADEIKTIKTAKEQTSTENDEASAQMNGMDMGSSSDIVTLNYSMLRAPKKTTLPSWPERTFYFNLTGNMNRYVWTIDNKTVSEAKNIYIKRGENIRIVMFNNTMMRHPMHLHGHFFRVINGQGEYAPLKNVLDIMPMETDTIEFAATESGDWFFHCHILYHMMSGMGRVFTYVDSPPNPELPDARYARRKLFQDDREFHVMARVGLESNGSDGEAMLANTRWKVETMWHLGLHEHHGYESETMIGRYLGRMQWWYVFAGYDYHRKKLMNGMESGMGDLIGNNIFGDDAYNLFGQKSDKNNRSTVVAGVQYTLPMLVIAEMRVDLSGKLRFQLSREDVPVTPRLRFNVMANTDKEYAIGLRYILSKYFSISSHYDSDMGLGAGVTITY